MKKSQSGIMVIEVLIIIAIIGIILAIIIPSVIDMRRGPCVADLPITVTGYAPAYFGEYLHIQVKGHYAKSGEACVIPVQVLSHDYLDVKVKEGVE